MADRIVWRGTQAEAAELLSALNRFCRCDELLDDPMPGICPGHLILEDQRALDRLVFARRIATRFVSEEFGVTPSAAPAPRP